MVGRSPVSPHPEIHRGVSSHFRCQCCDMNWSPYEIFSVLSGVVLLVTAAVGPAYGAELSAKDRTWTVAGGAGYVAYGFYVANATSGHFVFPVVVFVIPFVFAGWIVLNAYSKRKPAGPGVPRPSTGHGSGAPVTPGFPLMPSPPPKKSAEDVA